MIGTRHHFPQYVKNGISLVPLRSMHSERKRESRHRRGNRRPSVGGIQYWGWTGDVVDEYYGEGSRQPIVGASRNIDQSPTWKSTSLTPRSRPHPRNNAFLCTAQGAIKCLLIMTRKENAYNVQDIPN